MQPSHRLTEDDATRLERLDAVEYCDVARNVVVFSDWFKRDFAARYARGERPVDIFRSVGVTPALVGRKRIEKCTRRWRRPMEGDDR